MRIKKLNDGAERVFAVVFQSGEDPMAGLTEMARQREFNASSFTGIGAFRRAVLGFFDLDRSDYHRIPVEEQCEVVSLTGNIALVDGAPSLHIHATLGRRDGSAVVGHLLEAEVRPTLELILTELPACMARRRDPATGLPLLAPSNLGD
ncbi:PPC domain-containing DNA-binding protein [Azospirillum sp. SYSU D00513]|uniref:PPC domain-containing DNA-binding protein n=1 Tax=Azospirillum sp. SYSU D00513 TaxID=2812561 RepID=UPI001A96F910|nr:PPC domain-containing DNA-binding protein [Azospirillum sp. SYSU D00513]